MDEKCLHLRHGTWAQDRQLAPEAGAINSPVLLVIQILMQNFQASQYARLKDTAAARSAVAGSMTGSCIPTSKGHMLLR